MANLSNINGKFVVEQTTGYVGVGTTDPSYPIEVLNASAEIALNASGGSIYRLRSDSTDSFRINKNGVGDRLVIAGDGVTTVYNDFTIDNSSPEFYMTTGSTHHNWRVAAQEVVNEGFEIASQPAAGGAYTNHLVILGTSGNVGIGTDSPDAQLDIEKTAAGTTFVPYLQLSQTYTVADSKYGILFKNTTYGWDEARISVERQSSAADFDLVLSSANSGNLVEGIRIDHLGNVGIGTSSPSATTKLHIRNATSNSYATLRLEGSNRGGIIQMYNQTSYPVSSIQTDQSGNTYFSTSGAFASTTLSTKMSILTTGELIQGNNTDGITPGTSLLRLANTGIYGSGQTGPYGTYGAMIFNATTNYTGGAKRYMITNGYQGTSLAFIRSANASTDPAISGDGGTVSSGSVSYYIASTGYNIFPENVGIGATSPSYGKLQVDQTSGNNLTLRKGTGQPAIAFGGVTGNEATCLIEGNGASGGLKFYNGTGTLASPTWSAGMEFFDSGRLYPYGGVYLGAASSSNLLDDYEEGTFTATMTNDGQANTTVASYTKIGRMVSYTVYFAGKNITNAGNAQISGFPFSASTNNGYGTGFITHSTACINSSGGYHSGTIWVSAINNGTSQALWQVASNRSIMVVGFYYTTA